MSTIYTTTQNGQKILAICRFEKSRNGFRHVVELQTENGYILSEATVHYINRTWEVYDFQTAIHKAIDRAQLAKDKAQNEKKRKALKRQFDRRGCPSYYGARRVN